MSSEQETRPNNSENGVKAGIDITEITYNEMSRLTKELEFGQKDITIMVSPFFVLQEKHTLKEIAELVKGEKSLDGIRLPPNAAGSTEKLRSYNEHLLKMIKETEAPAIVLAEQGERIEETIFVLRELGYKGEILTFDTTSNNPEAAYSNLRTLIDESDASGASVVGQMVLDPMKKLHTTPQDNFKDPESNFRFEPDDLTTVGGMVVHVLSGLNRPYNNNVSKKVGLGKDILFPYNPYNEGIPPHEE